MRILNMTMMVTIAILYNIIIHNITSHLFRDKPFQEKMSSSITFLVIAGIFALVMSKIILEPSKGEKEGVVAKGLWVGGLMLLVTSLFVNWSSLGEGVKLSLMVMSFGGLIWWCKKNLDKDVEENTGEDTKN